ncbi:MAG: Wzz/FepE/Etk N-terminal domain-containing protein [Pseudomonadota bacterium]
MTIHDILAILYRRSGIIIGSFGTIVLFVTIFAYILPPGYQSTASVLVERTGATSVALTYAPNQEMVEILNTEAAIVQSRPVLTAVVEELSLDERGRTPKGIGKVMADLRSVFVSMGLSTDLPAKERWISNLERRLLIKPGTQSSVLTIGYSNTDPMLARDIVASTTRHYIKRHQEIFSDEGLPEFYAGRVADVEANLSELRGRLTEEISTADQDISLVISLRAEVSRLKGSLALQEAELAGALQRFLPGHPEVQRAEAQVTALKRAVADAEAELATLSAVSPEAEQIRSRIANDEGSLRELKAQYEAAVTAQRSQSSFLDVRLVSPANLPAKPTVSRLLIIFLGIVSGLGMAVMLGIIVEYLDERTFDPAEIEDILGLPCVGLVPHTRLAAQTN